MAPPPVVTGISPKEGPPGTRVTIRGEFLGSSANDLIGLKICGCECLLSAEWKSKNKIIARSGPCKGRGDIIVTTRSGGEGTSTVQFRGYHESVGLVKESAVWVEEAAPPALPWGRRPMSPTSYTPPDPLGLSTEGDDGKFPEEDLNELFPNGSGSMADENFEPGWYLLEHHSNTSYEDLKAGMAFLQRKVESQKEGQLSFLKANTGAVMDQLDRLVLLKNMFEDDQRRDGKEPLPSLQAAIEESISLADSLFSEILSRREHADTTREALSLLTRHKFLFQLPASIDKNIRRKEYDLVVNDYQRVKNLFGNTEVKLFQKILAEIDKKIEDLKVKLHERMKTMPINLQEQRKYISLLISLNWEGDAGWEAVLSRKEYLIQLLNKIKDHFKQKEDLESSDKGKRRGRVGAAEGGGGGGGGEWGAGRGQWCCAASGALAAHLAALWTAGRWYFAGDLANTTVPQQKHELFKDMIISVVQLFSEHMKLCLLTGNGTAPPEVTRKRLVANLRSLREAYDTLLKLDLPSQPLSIVERVIFVYRAHGASVFLKRCVKRVRSLADATDWRTTHVTEYGAVTNLPHLLESYIDETLSTMHKCVVVCGRRETPLFADPAGEPTAKLHKLTQQVLMAYVDVLQTALSNSDQNFSSGSLSVALDQRVESTRGSRRRVSWQQRLLLAATDAHYTRTHVLGKIQDMFHSYELPKPVAAIQATKEALSTLEANIAETYLEHKGDPLVGTIEPSMYMGRHNIDPEAAVDDVRPYVYEIINNLIAVHAEVDVVCGGGSWRYLRDISETVCEELSRLWGAAPPPCALRARLEAAALHAAAHSHLTPAARNYLSEVLAGLPPLDAEQTKRLESLIEDFKKRMSLQIAALNCTTDTV